MTGEGLYLCWHASVVRRHDRQKVRIQLLVRRIHVFKTYYLFVCPSHMASRHTVSIALQEPIMNSELEKRSSALVPRERSGHTAVVEENLLYVWGGCGVRKFNFCMCYCLLLQHKLQCKYNNKDFPYQKSKTVMTQWTSGMALGCFYVLWSTWQTCHFGILSCRFIKYTWHNI